MSPESMRRWLWVVALATMPVPYYLAQVESAPVLRLGFLTSLYGVVAIAEGGATLIGITTMGLLQTLLYLGLFYLATGVAARLFQRIASPPLQVAAVGTLIFLLVTSSLLPLYETPLSSAHAQSSLWQIFR